MFTEGAPPPGPVRDAADTRIAAVGTLLDAARDLASTLELRPLLGLLSITSSNVGAYTARDAATRA